MDPLPPTISQKSFILAHAQWDEQTQQRKDQNGNYKVGLLINFRSGLSPVGFVIFWPFKNLVTVRPIKQQYHFVSHLKQVIIDKEINEMLQLWVIESSKIPWCSPVCLLHKKDGDYRFCMDFRKVNQVTKKESFAIPFVSSTQAHLESSLSVQLISSLPLGKFRFANPPRK